MDRQHLKLYATDSRNQRAIKNHALSVVSYHIYLYVKALCPSSFDHFLQTRYAGHSSSRRSLCSPRRIESFIICSVLQRTKKKKHHSVNTIFQIPANLHSKSPVATKIASFADFCSRTPSPYPHSSMRNDQRQNKRTFA